MGLIFKKEVKGKTEVYIPRSIIAYITFEVISFLIIIYFLFYKHIPRNYLYAIFLVLVIIILGDAKLHWALFTSRFTGKKVIIEGNMLLPKKITIQGK